MKNINFVSTNLLIIGLFCYLTNANATDLSVGCVPITTLGGDNYGIDVQFTNNCGQCANVAANIFRDGQGAGLAGWYCGMQPNEAKNGRFTTGAIGNWQVKVTRVTTCDVKCP